MKQTTKTKRLVRSLLAAGVIAGTLGVYANYGPSVIRQAVAAGTEAPFAVKEDAAQLNADKVALQRQLKRLQADQARLQADTAAGKMSAESTDAYRVYRAKQAVSGEAKDIAADKTFSRQMKADEAGLQRQIKRLDAAEARLQADTREGKMSAESRDAEKVYKDQRAVQAERKQIVTDETRLKADTKK